MYWVEKWRIMYITKLPSTDGTMLSSVSKLTVLYIFTAPMMASSFVISNFLNLTASLIITGVLVILLAVGITVAMQLYENIQRKKLLKESKELKPSSTAILAQHYAQPYADEFYKVDMKDE
jgi:ABC-type transport system involved in multi-copper enzyme maturation permease subunit